MAECKQRGNCTQSDGGVKEAELYQWKQRSLGNAESTTLDPTILIPPRAVGAFGAKLFSRLAARQAANTVEQVAAKELMMTHGQTLSKKAMKRLTAGIAEKGIQQPLNYVEHNGTKYVVDGHHRLLAARRLGIEGVPVERISLPFRGYKTIYDLFGGP